VAGRINLLVHTRSRIDVQLPGHLSAHRRDVGGHYVDGSDGR
jgi:hypothetical protein